MSDLEYLESTADGQYYVVKLCVIERYSVKASSLAEAESKATRLIGEYGDHNAAVGTVEAVTVESVGLRMKVMGY